MKSTLAWLIVDVSAQAAQEALVLHAPAEAAGLSLRGHARITKVPAKNRSLSLAVRKI
ncbi:MAG: hypothetical protein V4653_01540 [Pseudomonadota bacterium]